MPRESDAHQLGTEQTLSIMETIWSKRESLCLNKTDTAVLVRLVAMASDEGFCISPNLQTLFEATGFSPRTLQRSLRSLRDKNLLVKVRDFLPSFSSQKSRSAVYRINLLSLYSVTKERAA